MRLQDVILRDTLAARPDATAVPAGSLYFDTTNSVLYRSDGTNWASVSPTATLADGDYGDITVGSSGTTLTIDAGAVTEAKQTLADNTTNDVSTTKHGYAPKAPNDATKFLDGTGAYSVPSGATEQKTPAFIEGSETAQIFERIQAGSNITITEIAGGEAISIASAAGGSTVGDMLDYVYAEQTADQSKTSNTTFADLTGLSFAIGASEKWIVDFYIFYRAGTAEDIKFGMTWPTSCVVDVSTEGPATSIAGDVNEADGRWQVIRPASSGDLVAVAGGNKGGAGNTPMCARLTCRIANSTNAGTIQLTYAQLVSGGTSTEVFGASGSTACSFLEARRVL